MKTSPFPPAVARSERGIPGTMSLTAPAGAASSGSPFPSLKPAPAPPGRARLGGQKSPQVESDGKAVEVVAFSGVLPEIA